MVVDKYNMILKEREISQSMGGFLLDKVDMTRVDFSTFRGWG
jgi:hypothetical protein